jgi:hypothetical protein
MVFLAFEDDQSGQEGIRIPDLVKGLKALCVKLTPAQALAFGASLDGDGDGNVNLREFMSAARWEMKKLDAASAAQSGSRGNSSVGSRSNASGNLRVAQGLSALSLEPRDGGSPRLAVARRGSAGTAPPPGSELEHAARRLSARTDALRARATQQPPLLARGGAAVDALAGHSSTSKRGPAASKRGPAAMPSPSPGSGSGLSGHKFEERALPLPKTGGGRSGGSTRITLVSPGNGRSGNLSESRGGKGSAAEASTTASATATSSAAKASAAEKIVKSSPTKASVAAALKARSPSSTTAGGGKVNKAAAVSSPTASDPAAAPAIVSWKRRAEAPLAPPSEGRSSKSISRSDTSGTLHPPPASASPAQFGRKSSFL